MPSFNHVTRVLGASVLFLAAGFPSASASVWTDQADYAPGSVVTISGGVSEGAAYLDGEAVDVSVEGPNGYTAACTDDAVENGAWSCTITLWDSLDAVGSYTYTALGRQSGTTEMGTFTDKPADPEVNFAVTASGLDSEILSLQIHMVYTVTPNTAKDETNTVSSAASYSIYPKKNTDVTYSGFLDTVTAGSKVCTRNVGQSASGSLINVDTNTDVTVAYTCITPDTTPPVISYNLYGTTGTNGWYTSDVFVDWTVTDSETAVVIDSGCTDETLTAETKGTTRSCVAHSGGGSASDTTTLIKIDKTGPSALLSVTAGTAGSNGWYTTNVTVQTTGSDAISETVTCTADQYQTSETTGTVFNGSCTNDAGLTTAATPLTVKLDKTGPSITWSNALPANGGTYYWGDSLPGTLTCTSADSISGVTPGTCGVTGYSTDIGTHSAVAQAVNLAGLTTTETRTYTVSAWTLTGFYSPVTMGLVWNVVKAGSTVPLKFEVFKGSTELISKDAIVSGPGAGFSFIKDPVGGPPPFETEVIPTDALTSGKTQLRYDSTSGQFIENWQTPKTPGYYKVILTTKDGSSLVAWFYLK